MTEKPLHRYYCLHRPPAPGAIPHGAWSICNFGDRIQILEIGGREAWGYVEYRQPLDATSVDQYELLASRKNVDAEANDNA